MRANVCGGYFVQKNRLASLGKKVLRTLFLRLTGVVSPKVDPTLLNARRVIYTLSRQIIFAVFGSLPRKCPFCIYILVTSVTFIYYLRSESRFERVIYSIDER